MVETSSTSALVMQQMDLFSFEKGQKPRHFACQLLTEAACIADVCWQMPNRNWTPGASLTD